MTRVRLASEELQAMLEKSGHRVEGSPVNLVTYRVHRVATEESPAVLVGEMSEQEIWSWLTDHCTACDGQGRRYIAIERDPSRPHLTHCEVCNGIGRVMKGPSR
jgi:hypothetical protein